LAVVSSGDGRLAGDGCLQLWARPASPPLWRDFKFATRIQSRLVATCHEVRVEQFIDEMG